MATTTSDTPTNLNLPNAAYEQAFNDIYNSIEQNLITPQTITLEQQTRESLAAQLNESLRPYMDMAAAQRQQAAVQGRAELDADAYSRGMGSSTWLTDKKSRESMAAQSDIANIKAQYGASLAENVNSGMQTYNANKLAVDQANVANRLAADQWNAQEQARAYELAYKMLLDQIKLGAFNTGSSGSGTSSSGNSETMVWSPISGTYIPISAAPATPEYNPGYLLSH